MSVNHVISGLSILVTGSFTPSIIQPNWLIKNKIENSADDNLIDKRYLTLNISEFSISGINYRISLENLIIETEIEPLRQVFDRLEKISKHLIHTPITVINMIRYDHLRVSDEVHRTKIFRKLAPIQLGGTYGKGLNENQAESKVNLHTLTFKEDFLKDGISLTKLVTIEPSLNKAIYNDGIYIGVQFLYNKLEGEFSFYDYVQLVKNEFENRDTEAKNIFSAIEELK